VNRNFLDSAVIGNTEKLLGGVGDQVLVFDLGKVHSFLEMKKCYFTDYEVKIKFVNYPT
jgi:hypothetical protein